MPETDGENGPPPGDDNHNDRTIDSGLRVLRRIPPGKITKDLAGGPSRPQSGNFENHPDGSGTSVDIWEAQRVPTDLLQDGLEAFGVVSLSIEDIRQLDLGVIRWPLDGNPHHAHLQGRKTGGKRKRLAKLANWEIPIPNADL